MSPVIPGITDGARRDVPAAVDSRYDLVAQLHRDVLCGLGNGKDCEKLVKSPARKTGLLHGDFRRASQDWTGKAGKNKSSVF